MVMSVDSTQATTKQATAKHEAKMICKHIKLTGKNWDPRQNKAVPEGRLYRGRAAQKPGQPRDEQEAFRLQGNSCHIATRITPGPETSTVPLAKQRQGSKQTTALRNESDSSNEYFVPKADEILVEVHKVLVFRHEDPFINAVCNKRCSKSAKERAGRFSREICRDVKNAYFRKSFKTAGERALDEDKAANSSRQGYIKGAGNKDKASSMTYNDIPAGTEREETKIVELFNKQDSPKAWKDRVIFAVRLQANEGIE